jgi:ABC-type molybdenum transport system ATPase subunit/photorepair protein PhrA
MQLQDQKIGNYNTGFAQYEKTREIEDAQREKMIAQFMAKNQNIDHFSPDYKTKDNYSKWLAARQKRKIAMEGKFKFKHPAPLKAPPGVEQKDISLIKLEDVTFCYNVEAGLPYIFKTPISYDVKVGTRVGIMGPNGAGKSTILKLITAFLHPTTGTVTRNPDFTLAYFGQHSTKELQMEDTPIEFMVKSFPKANKGDLISHLEKTGVLRNAQDARMKNISFSQRSCVVFAKLTFVPPHLLIMDEPTNFLDLESVDSLIKAANAFKGGLITVTHNRDFLKRCSKHFLSIVPGAFLEFDTMKDAERATYSFIGALERGEDVDHKTAIQENRGGGAEHSAEYLAKKEAERKKILKEQDERRKAEAAALAEAARLLAIKEEKEAKKKASQRTDWKKDEVCWAPIPGQRGAVWTKVVVVRNIPAMGVTVALPGGGNKLFEAKKLKMENPEGGKNAAPVQQAKGGRGGGRGAGNQKGGRGAKGGRGGRGNNRAQSAPKGGGRGGARGAAGGRGGRGQRQRGQRKNSASAA